MNCETCGKGWSPDCVLVSECGHCADCCECPEEDTAPYGSVERAQSVVQPEPERIIGFYYETNDSPDEADRDDDPGEDVGPQVRYITNNSVYEVDLEGMRYQRTHRGGDASIEATVESHRLTYGEWHPMKRPPEVAIHPADRKPCLRLWREDSNAGIYTSPLIGTECPSPTSCPPMTRAMCMYDGIHPIAVPSHLLRR